MAIDSFSLSASSGTMLESDLSSSSSELDGILSELPSEQSALDGVPAEAFVAVAVAFGLRPVRVLNAARPPFVAALAALPSLFALTLNAVLMAMILPVSSCM